MDRQKFINVLCVGDCKVGKSTILRRVRNDQRGPKSIFSHIGLETLHFKTISKNTKVSLNIWDVSVILVFVRLLMVFTTFVCRIYILTLRM